VGLHDLVQKELHKRKYINDQVDKLLSECSKEFVTKFE